MLLVDTSVWIDHLRNNDPELARQLNAGNVGTHPFVIGELALGNLRQRDLVIGNLCDLPQAQVATDEEILRFITQQALYGLGIGYVDAHLMAASRLTPGTMLWTRDKRLSAAASRLGLDAGIP